MFGWFRDRRDTPEEICCTVAAQLREALPECRLTESGEAPFSFELVAKSDGRSINLYLGNLVADVQSVWTKVERRDVIERFVQMVRESMFPPPITLDRVHLALRNRAFFAPLEGAWEEDELFEDGPGDLVETVMADVGQGLRTVTTPTAEEAGFSVAEVRAAAERNLLAALDGLGTSQPAPGIVSASIDDYPWLGTSLLLMPKVLEIVTVDQGWRRAILSSVTRESVDFVNADDPVALGQMERWMREQFSTDPRPQSDLVWTMRPGNEVPVKSHRMVDDKLVALS